MYASQCGSTTLKSAVGKMPQELSPLPLVEVNRRSLLVAKALRTYLLSIGNVHVEVVDHRRGLSNDAGVSRVVHTHDLEVPLLAAVAKIRHPDEISCALAHQLFDILHIPDVERLGQ